MDTIGIVGVLHVQKQRPPNFALFYTSQVFRQCRAFVAKVVSRVNEVLEFLWLVFLSPQRVYWSLDVALRRRSVERMLILVPITCGSKVA